jgi:hypothetical protein
VAPSNPRNNQNVRACITLVLTSTRRAFSIWQSDIILFGYHHHISWFYIGPIAEVYQNSKEETTEIEGAQAVQRIQLN